MLKKHNRTTAHFTRTIPERFKSGWSNQS